MLVISRAYRFRLYPDAEQEKTLSQWVGVTRLVYNLALEQRRDWWRQYRAATGRSLNYASQGPELSALRREFDYIGAIHSTPLIQALRDLDRAFSAFFAGRAGYPSPRRRGVNDTFRLNAIDVRTRTLNHRWGALRIPKLGWVKFRQSRSCAGELVNVTVSRDVSGWYVAFALKIDLDAPANDNPAIGIDRGVAVSLALSNGETYSMPNLEPLERRRRHAQRALARCVRGSARRQKRLRRIRLISARIARIRADWQHRISRDIADRFGTVALEDLKIRALTRAGHSAQKRGLNRSIQSQAWASFATKLAYKIEERGGIMIKVDPAYTSQACSDCGAIDSESRKSQASFVCTSCGFALNADHNAAINILRRSTSELPVEGRGCAPCEAGTMLVAA